MDHDSFAAKVDDAHVFESAADCPARAVVDGTGRLVGFRLDTALLRQHRDVVAQAVLDAVTEAQDAAAAHRADRLARAEAVERQLTDALAEASRPAYLWSLDARP
jgi:hypothetical protein